MTGVAGTWTAWRWAAAILLLVILPAAGGIWLLRTQSDSGATTADDARVAAPAPAAPEPIEPAEPTSGELLLLWLDESDSASPAPAHEFTREGLRSTMAALDDLVARETAPAIQARLTRLRAQNRDILQPGADPLEHAAQARHAFTAAVDVLAALQRTFRPPADDLEPRVARARAAAERIRSDAPLGEQYGAIREFFRLIGQAIRGAERHSIGT